MGRKERSKEECIKLSRKGLFRMEGVCVLMKVGENVGKKNNEYIYTRENLFLIYVRDYVVLFIIYFNQFFHLFIID